MNRDSLKSLLIRHEGLSLKPYKDSKGLLTIGYGRCLDSAGISEQEAIYLFENDIARCISSCREKLSWFNDLDDTRQNVVVSLVFNMGIGGFLEFKKMIAAVEKKDWQAASSEMLMSRWAAQVGRRAVELAQMMLDGDTIH